jgi:hypothetical protein
MRTWPIHLELGPLTLTLSYAYFGASLASIAGAGEPATLSGAAVPDPLTASPFIV